MIAHCRTALAGYKCPKRVELRDELPAHGHRQAAEVPPAGPLLGGTGPPGQLRGRRGQIGGPAAPPDRAAAASRAPAPGPVPEPVGHRRDVHSGASSMGAWPTSGATSRRQSGRRPPSAGRRPAAPGCPPPRGAARRLPHPTEAVPVAARAGQQQGERPGRLQVGGVGRGPVQPSGQVDVGLDHIGRHPGRVDAADAEHPADGLFGGGAGRVGR